MPIKGSNFEIAFDTLITAVGQDLRHEGFEELLVSSWIGTDELGQTSQKGIFAGGDAATGPGLVAEAIGAGSKAAIAIDAFINGGKVDLPEKKEISYKDVPLNDWPKIVRNIAEELPVKQRLAAAAAEVNMPLNPEQVQSEVKRCLGCGMQEPKFTGMPYFGKFASRATTARPFVLRAHCLSRTTIRSIREGGHMISTTPPKLVRECLIRSC